MSAELVVMDDDEGVERVKEVEVIVSVKIVVCVSVPVIAVTVIGKDPVGTVLMVEIVSVLTHVGTHDEEGKEALAPMGRPETEKDRDGTVPERSVAVISFVTEEP